MELPIILLCTIFLTIFNVELYGQWCSWRIRETKTTSTPPPKWITRLHDTTTVCNLVLRTQTACMQAPSSLGTDLHCTCNPQPALRERLRRRFHPAPCYAPWFIRRLAVRSDVNSVPQHLASLSSGVAKMVEPGARPCRSFRDNFDSLCCLNNALRGKSVVGT